MFEITVEGTFASAHQLIGYEGPCENIHGHTWKVAARIVGDRLDKLGMLYDFKKAKAALNEILLEFDHKKINDLSYFRDKNPTAENIAKIIYELFNAKIDKATVSSVTVWESEKTCATYSL